MHEIARAFCEEEVPDQIDPPSYSYTPRPEEEAPTDYLSQYTITNITSDVVVGEIRYGVPGILEDVYNVDSENVSGILEDILFETGSRVNVANYDVVDIVVDSFGRIIVYWAKTQEV